MQYAICFNDIYLILFQYVKKEYYKCFHTRYFAHIYLAVNFKNWLLFREGFSFVTSMGRIYILESER